MGFLNYDNVHWYGAVLSAQYQKDIYKVALFFQTAKLFIGKSKFYTDKLAFVWRFFFR